MRSRGPRILEGLMGLCEVQRSHDLKLSEGVDR
jgi:hypothetical protein